MALADTGDRQLARRIAKATAEELISCGINWVLGPVLDMLTNAHNQPLGVRSFGEDQVTVSSFGVEQVKGFQEGGIATCGKHFPSYGNLEFFGAPTDVPTITESLENLSRNALVPFTHAIQAGIDAMMVGGVAMSSNYINVMHACLSDQICRDLLRTEMKFQGVVVSECLEMEALSRNIGISGGTVMAFKAGCDLILTCRSMHVQEEAIHGLTAGLENGMIERSRVQESCARVLALKSRYTSWEKAFSPPGINNLDRLRNINSKLSTVAYNTTVRIVRDRKNYLPLSKTILPTDEVLLLTPLVKPLPASAAFKRFSDEAREQSLSPHPNYATQDMVMTGERLFQYLGRLLARHRNGKVLHASYTANGVRPQHEALLQDAKAVIVITADAGRNKYQAAFAKHIAMLCRLSEESDTAPKEKPCIVAAVSSPFDFTSDRTIGTYLCSYDFTDNALQALVRLLHEEPKASSVGASEANIKVRRPSHARQQWLVENYRDDKDRVALDRLLAIARTSSKGISDLLANVAAGTFLLLNDLIDEAHFVVRNSSTKELIGFCATYFHKEDQVGSIGAIVVHPSRRHQSVGHSLHDRAIRTLLQKQGESRLKLGARLPNVFPGIPNLDDTEHSRLTQWFVKLGWRLSRSHPTYRMTISNLTIWEAPEGLGQSLASDSIKYDLVHGEEYTDSVMGHVRMNATAEVQALYGIALSNKEGCAIIRGKQGADARVVATVLLYRHQSRLASVVPQLQSRDSPSGGIGSAVMAENLGNKAAVLQGLILLGVRQLKKQGIKSLLLDYVGSILLFVRQTQLTSFRSTSHLP